MRAIAIARAGILPLLLLGILVVFAWTRALAGEEAALLAVLAFTSVPPVLAHSGLATTDAAAMATIALAVYAFVRWLGRPGVGETLLVGVAGGLAVLAKMSALVFLPAIGTALLALWLFSGRRVSVYIRPAALAVTVTLLLVWAGYRFSVGPVLPTSDPGPAAAASLTVPAPELPRGFLQMLGENAKGRRTLLLGDRYVGGRWYYFPVAIGVKTPLPFLILAGIGGVALLRLARISVLAAAPVITAATILLLALPSNLNIGVRHVLPIYPPLAVCAGVGLLGLWRRKPAGSALAAALMGWLVVDTARAHPDYLPYFNQLAGRHPEAVLVAGDLDWGQDLNRLADTVRARHIPHLWIAYHGKADLRTAGLPPFTMLPPDTLVHGWVAASMFSVLLGQQAGSYDAYAWLRQYRPVAQAGRSMLLYYIAPP